MAGIERNQYGRPIVQGVVFGYLCVGRGGNARDDKVYRFGRSTKMLNVEPDARIRALGAGPSSGLNRPEALVL